MVSIILPAAMGTWTIEDMIEGEAGINLYKAEKHTDQGQVLSLVKIIPIPENNDVLDELMEEEGCREAAELRLRIMLDSYVQNIKQQEKMRASPNILGVEEYAVEKRPESAGWILYERTAFAAVRNGRENNVVFVLSVSLRKHPHKPMPTSIKPVNNIPPRNRV